MATAAERRAAQKWRGRRRAAGLSWLCVISNHDACNGWVSRLQPNQENRPKCQCKCHQQEELDEE